MPERGLSVVGAFSLALLCLSGAIAPAYADTVKLAVPVMIGGDVELDACGALGKITGLDPKGDNFLSVRSGPGGKHAEVDRLSPGVEVTICDERGSWLGVVYPGKDSAVEDCGTDTLSPDQEPYTGPCRSGWVHQTFVTVIAG